MGPPSLSISHSRELILLLFRIVMTKANEVKLRMAPNTVKELKRLSELALRTPDSAPLKRQIEELQAKHEKEKGRKKAKLQAKKAANPSGLTGREERQRKVEAAEQAAVEKLADAADRAKRSLQEYTQLRERGASESELAYPSRKVLDHQAKEKKARDEVTEAEKRTQRALEALQRSLAKDPSAPSTPSPHPVPSPSGPSPPPSPSGSPHRKGKGKARAVDDNPRFLSSDDKENEDPSERLAREAQIEVDAELAAQLEQAENDYINDAGADESDDSLEGTMVVELVKKTLKDNFPSNGQALSSRDRPQVSAEIQIPDTVKQLLLMPKRAKRPTKIFKRKDGEKKAWMALASNYTVRVLRRLLHKYGIPRPKGGSLTKHAVIEQAFKYIETLPTSIDLDELREAIKLPPKDKWLTENWGNKAFNKDKKAFESKVKVLLKGKSTTRGISDLVEDLDIENWKGKNDVCIIRRNS